MKCRPITFTAPNVRAIRARAKTQTRRVMKCQLKTLPPLAIGCPYGAPGDLLWVKEPLFCDHVGRPTYTATDDNCDSPGTWKWKRKTLPAMFMPRIYSRSTLVVLDVRVERLQDISEEDAEAEGAAFTCEQCGNDVDTREGAEIHWACDDEHADCSHLEGFERLWDSINVKPEHRWDTNPWVWATTFRLKEDT